MDLIVILTALTMVGGIVLLSYKTALIIMEHNVSVLLEELNEKLSKASNRLNIAQWNYNMNLTDENLQKKVLDTEEQLAEMKKYAYEKVKDLDIGSFSDNSLKRQLKYYKGGVPLPEEIRRRLSEAINNMEVIYSTGKICLKEGESCDIGLDPDLQNILATSRDPEELKHVWVKWRDAVGPKCRPLFKEYVALSNEVARLSNLQDTSESWLGSYEDVDFTSKVDILWNQVKPLYGQLHAYIRTKLRDKYGDIVSERGPIPAHLLGDMWAQSWLGTINFTMPYPDVKEGSDLTEKLKQKSYTVMNIFKTAEEFYISIGLSKMTDSFWKKSRFVKIPNNDMVCHAYAADFSDGEDFRIAQCAEITGTHFVIAHHEMGHIEYFMQYKDQPYPFREGANDGFHEAIGDLIALSVQSTKHLHKIGLNDAEHADPKDSLNNLFQQGLYQIAFLPFSYLTDLWRWDVFSGKTDPQDYNCAWWKLRHKYQGVEPPVNRTENDFDPAAKYHIAADVPYLRYFISMILQYQFHKSLCEIANAYEENNPKMPLHECDIYQNKEAGAILKKMLAMGSSKPWPDALKVMTGQREMDASGILEYFRPLYDWLKNENRKNKAFVGWEDSSKVCTRG